MTGRAGTAEEALPRAETAEGREGGREKGGEAGWKKGNGGRTNPLCIPPASPLDP